MSDKVPYNLERYNFLCREIRRVKHQWFSRFKKFEKEHNLFISMISKGYLVIEYEETRKQWNKVNNHLIKLHHIDKQIKDMYREQMQMLSF